eukprot:9935502-Karenia_brevis.AAC.1
MMMMTATTTTTMTMTTMMMTTTTMIMMMRMINISFRNKLKFYSSTTWQSMDCVDDFELKSKLFIKT